MNLVSILDMVGRVGTLVSNLSRILSDVGAGRIKTADEVQRQMVGLMTIELERWQAVDHASLADRIDE